MSRYRDKEAQLQRVAKATIMAEYVTDKTVIELLREAL